MKSEKYCLTYRREFKTITQYLVFLSNFTQTLKTSPPFSCDTDVLTYLLLTLLHQELVSLRQSKLKSHSNCDKSSIQLCFKGKYILIMYRMTRNNGMLLKRPLQHPDFGFRKCIASYFKALLSKKKITLNF